MSESNPKSVPSTKEVEAVLASASTYVDTNALERALQEKVCAFTDSARMEGVLPEHVILLLRETVRRGGYHVSDRLMARMVEWCMKRYFETNS